eukprot:gene10265-8186_t
MLVPLQVCLAAHQCPAISVLACVGTLQVYMRRDIASVLGMRRDIASPVAQSGCGKCNLPTNQGGCKCDDNCNCKQGSGGTPSGDPSGTPGGTPGGTSGGTSGGTPGGTPGPSIYDIIPIYNFFSPAAYLDGANDHTGYSRDGGRQGNAYYGENWMRDIIDGMLLSQMSLPEVVLMRVKEEGSVTDNFEEIFDSTYYSNPSYGKLFWKGASDNPTLGQVRGQVVVMRDFSSRRA